MKRMIAAGAALALLLPATAALAQQPAKGKDATPPKAAAATAPAGKTLYQQGQFDLRRQRPGRQQPSQVLAQEPHVDQVARLLDGREGVQGRHEVGRPDWR